MQAVREGFEVMNYSDFLKEVKDRATHQPLDVSKSTREKSLPEYVLINKEILDEILTQLWRAD